MARNWHSSESNDENDASWIDERSLLSLPRLINDVQPLALNGCLGDNKSVSLYV